MADTHGRKTQASDAPELGLSDLHVTNREREFRDTEFNNEKRMKIKLKVD